MPMHIIRQSEATECGLACIAMVANYFGHKVDLAGLRQRTSVSLKGAMLRDLMTIADHLDLSTRAVRLEVDDLEDLQLPAILHWDLNHFVVLKSVRGGKALILDPALGERRLARSEVSKHFTGVALEFTAAADFKPVTARVKTRLSDLWTRITGLKKSIIQLFVLSIILQAFTLAVPFYIQIVTDEVITRGDSDLLLLLAVAFAVVHFLSAATEALRSWTVNLLGQSMTFQMAGNVLRHLVRLPADFFQKRHVGDIISRMGSVQPIQTALTQGAVSAIIDGLMAITTAAMMLAYSWKLALVVFCFTALYILLALISYPLRRAREAEEIAARASEQTHMIETIRAARAVKLFGREVEREASWRNLYSQVVNCALAAARLEIGLKFFNMLLFGLSLVLVVYFGAHAIMDGELTIGMLLAFLAYRQNFTERAGQLVAQAIEFRMLSLHLERLADISQARPEQGLKQSLPIRPVFSGGIKIDDVSFRYAPSEPYVLEDISLDIEPRSFVAIVGGSGRGKTTLLNVMLGLLKPERGEICIDGKPLSSFGLGAWRDSVGVVMQDDQLLSGTIADNISFFDTDIDMQKVMDCAQLARVHDDIMRMPMNYLSLIGDMGDALSGGQRQRLLLARALYKNPGALFLDEGTANLDPQSEREIADVIAAMPITRVVIAHRPELIKRADVVYEMNDTLMRQEQPPLSDAISA